MALSEIEIVSDSNDQQTSGFRNPNEPAIVDVYAACAYGDFDKLRKFVEVDGVSVYQPDGNGYYALQWAALNNFADIVQYIIEVLLFAFLLNEGRVFNCSFGSQVWCFLFVVCVARGKCPRGRQFGTDCVALGGSAGINCSCRCVVAEWCAGRGC